jgi:hypothetical protein
MAIAVPVSHNPIVDEAENVYASATGHWLVLTAGVGNKKE